MKNIKEAKNIGIVHHNKDTDGFLSAAIVVKELDFNNITNYKLIPYNYELDFEGYVKDKLNLNIQDFDLLIFTDCTPPTKWFEEFMDYGKYFKQKLMFIDHHKSKLEELITVMETVAEHKNASGEYEIFEQKFKNINHEITLINFNGNHNYVAEVAKTDHVQNYIEFYISLTEGHNRTSAAYLAARKFMKDAPLEVQRFIELTSLYDTWRWFNNDTQEIINEKALYLETYLRNSWDKQDWDDRQKSIFFNLILTNPLELDYICNEGEKLYWFEMGQINYENYVIRTNLPSTQSDQYENIIAMTSYGEKASFINQFYTRQYFKTLLNINIDIMMFIKFKYDENIVSVSMRSIHLDLRKFIKYLDIKYGDTDNRVTGGGHFQAAHAIMTFKTYNSMMSNFKHGLGHTHIYNNLNFKIAD